jgi:hypothetical protein
VSSWQQRGGGGSHLSRFALLFYFIFCFVEMTSSIADVFIKNHFIFPRLTPVALPSNGPPVDRRR